MKIKSVSGITMYVKDLEKSEKERELANQKREEELKKKNEELTKEIEETKANHLNSSKLNEESDKKVTTDFVERHLKIGVDSLKELINDGMTVRHLRF